MPIARLRSVNVGRPTQIAVSGGRPVMSAIGKEPVAGRARVAGVNVEGDDQADRRAHGGPDQAVYAYAGEDADWWAAELSRDVPAGIFGENLTTEGLDVNGARIGDRWAIGSTVLEVSRPRIPCAKLAARFGDQRMVKRFAQAGRPGAYLRIVEEGELGAGDAIEVVHRADGHDVTVALVAHAILHDHERLPELLAAPALPQPLRDWIVGLAA